jgi:hypothetical protein
MSRPPNLRLTPRRLVCIVEGKGEVEAVPNLCARILKEIGAGRWFVDQQPVRQPRSRLVDERTPPPNRLPRVEYLTAAVEMAACRSADAVLVLCDSDDDCAAVWGPAAAQVVRGRIAGAAVMVTREYESWLLASLARGPTIDGRTIECIRDPKKYLVRSIPGYKPTVHQLRATRSINIAAVRAASASFDKLVRSLAEIAEVDPGGRPLVG